MKKLTSLLAVTALGITACGGGDSTTEATESPPSAEEGTATPPVADEGRDDRADDEPADSDENDTDDENSGAGSDAETPDEATTPLSFEGHLSGGDCFDDRFDEEGDYDYSLPPAIVDCAVPHDNEVVAVHVLEEGPDAPFPDDEDTWDPLFADVCIPAFDDFLGISGTPSALNGYYLRPEEEEWNAGARTIACVLYLPDAQLEGTLRGVGQDVFPAAFPDDAPMPDGIVLSSAGSIEDSYSPSERFAAEAGIDTEGFFGATFEGGEADAVKAALQSAIASSEWDTILEDPWQGDIATTFYALGAADSSLIVEIWELEGGDSRLHYFYRPG